MSNNKHLLTEKWIEAVPNFSEGRNNDIIEAICAEIENQPDVYLLHKDIGYDAHRTVITFAGKLEQMEKICFNVIQKAAQLIDMRRHQGTHPRQGAIDVFPLIPLGTATFQDAIELSKRIGQRVATDLGIPVYLYEKSTENANRNRLEQIRKGEYEGFKQKILQPEWKPDFGLPKFNEKTGNIIMGARDFLLAYNVNLGTNDVQAAKNIAGVIRESGMHGKKGKLLGVKAIGWWVEEWGISQVSTNITHFRQTSIFDVFDTIREEAKNVGIETLGSELIGLIPLEALTDKHFEPEAAIKYLGLESFRPFNPKERILEWNLSEQIANRKR